MAQRQRDPFVRPHLQFTAAHDRLAAELRNAKRAAAGTAVPWDGDLTAREQVFLSHLVDQELHGNNYKITPQTRMNPPSEIDSLVAKGMIAIGTIAEGVLWTGEANIKWTPRTDVFDVKSTERGRNKLKESKNGQAAESKSSQ